MSKPTNPIFYNPQLQTLTCRGCRVRMEIPPRVYNDMESLAMSRERMEQEHIERGCGEAMLRAQEAAYKPSDRVSSMRTAWGDQ